MAEVNGTDHLVRHEKESKANGYDNEGYHCPEKSEDEEESASDDDRLRVVVTENGHRPEDDSHMANGYVHEESNGHSTTVNGSAVIVIEENKSDSNMNDNKEDISQKPLDTRLHHYVPVDDLDRKILNGSDGTHVTIPEDAVINFSTGRVKVKKGSSNNSQVSNERESIPLETMLPSYEAEDKIGLGEKAELEAELTNHKNGLWSEGNNTYSNSESPFGNSEKLNGTSKSSDEISLPVNNHRKCLRGEKLYFTEESRKLCPGWRRVFVCGLILIIIAVALLLGVLAATGILLAESESKNSRFESGHSLPSSDFISQAGHSLRPRPSFNKVPQKFLPPVSEGTNTTTDPVSRTSSPAVSSKVPVLNDTSHSQTIVPNALVGEFTIDEIFTDDLKDSSSHGYQTLAKYIERELYSIFKKSGGIFDALRILSFSPGSIKIKFVTIWTSDRNVILSTKAEEIFKSYLRKNRNSLLAYPVDLDNIHFIDVFDECKVQKGGCSFNCVWDYQTLSKMCICGENMILLADGKSCGTKPLTNAFNTTTPKSISTQVTATDQPLIKKTPETTKEEDKTTPTTTVIPTIVTKAIISITELFHNLTSTAIPILETESTINLQNLSTLLSEYSPSGANTTTMKSYSPENITTTEKYVLMDTTTHPIHTYVAMNTTTHIPEVNDETTTESNTITHNPNTENTENDNILKGSNITETIIPSHSSITSPIPKSELETTTLSLLLKNSSVDFAEQSTALPEKIGSPTETTTHLPLTEHATTQEDTTIGYHIKEETTEMYTFQDNTEFVTSPEFDATTKKSATLTTTSEVTTSFREHITELTTTTEVMHSPATYTPKNIPEMIGFNATDESDNESTNATIIAEDLETTTMNSEKENVTETTVFIAVTKIPNEEMQDKINATSPTDILDEANVEITDATDLFLTTTSEPLTVTPQPIRPPEVRSFDDDYENETTTRSPNFNSFDNFTNDYSLQTNKQSDKNETVAILDSITTIVPTTELIAETTLFEITTEKPTVHEETTHFVPTENMPITTTEENLLETTAVPEIFSREINETTVNDELASMTTTKSSHINKNHVVINDGDDATTTQFVKETIIEGEATTTLPTEIETHTETVIEINNTAKAHTFLKNSDETITTLTSIDAFKNGTMSVSNDSETTENSLLGEETTTSSYKETTLTHILETTLLHTESSSHTTVTGSDIVFSVSNVTEQVFDSSEAVNSTENEFNLFTTPEPMNISEELTTVESNNTLDDLDLTSLETSNFSNSNTELPTDVTPTISSGFSETLTLATVPDHTMPTPPYPNGSEIEVTTESSYDAEAFTFTESENETLYPFDMDSNFTETTDMPFESSFLEINSTLMSGSNESLENNTYFGEFENFTTEVYDAANETSTNASTGVECREDQFLCEPLNSCINDTFKCDGIEDCPDGRDEFECTGSCHSNFMCVNSSTCIMSDARCDGIWDCENGTDEENCSPTECAQHEVMCLDHSKCIKPGDICDWQYNCLDRSDEVGCVERTTCESNGRFFCNDGLCIPWSLKCDGEHDCKEGEDEGNCTCLSDEFQCNDGKCLKSSSRCDGHQDCHDADDEMGCVTVDNQHLVSTYEPYSGTWGLLCAEDWNLDDGQYLCQELGFGHALNVERVHVSFNGTWMAMRRENLTEASLWTERVSFVESCTSGLAAAVECQKFVCGEYSGLLHRRRRDVISSASPWPFIGYASTFQTNKGCLSEILTPIWLVASAECLLSISKEPFNGSDWYVRTNLGREVEADLAQNHEVLRIINHPHSSKFRSLTLRDYDVALIRLKHALVFVSDKIGAICPPEEQVPPGITCFSGVLGTERPRAPPPPVLTINSLALQITDRRNCNSVEHFNNAINPRMLCTQSSEGHTICDNDEGTPLMCLGGINKWFLAGMLTYQRFCDVYSKHPAVFSNLFSMRKFLDQVTGQKQYEVSYDSSMYIIIPPTTPSPTMSETTTPEMTALYTTEFSFTNTTDLTTVDFENGTETILDGLEEINGTTEMNEELAREEFYTTVLPEELIGPLTNTTDNEDSWNETVTVPYEMDTDVLNTTLGELEKSADEISVNRTHDDLMLLLNETYSTDDTVNDTIISSLNIEFSNVTDSSTLEMTTVAAELTNAATALEINDSLITTTEFVKSDNETTILTTEQSADSKKAEINTEDIGTDAPTTVHPSLISIMKDSADYTKFTTSSVDLTTTVINDTVQVFKPMVALNEESKVISQPLIALINDTKELESPTTTINLAALENITENFSTDATVIEPQDSSHLININSETTTVPVIDFTDFKENTTIETTTQPTVDETEAVTFVIEGEPDTDLAFSLFKNPDGLKIESYRMLEDYDFRNMPEENISLSIEQDANVTLTTESDMTSMPTVATTVFPEPFTNETEKRDLMFNTLDSISSTSDMNSTINLTSEAEIKLDNTEASILLPPNTTGKYDLRFETDKDEMNPESKDLVNNNLNYSMPLIYEDGFSLDITNKSSFFFPNVSERHDSTFYNITEKTVPKSVGLDIVNVNYSVPLAFEYDSKLDIENAQALSFTNETEEHDLMFSNVTNKIIPKTASFIIDDMNYSVPVVSEDVSKLNVENASSFSFSNETEERDLIFSNVTDKIVPKSASLVTDDKNYSVPLDFEDYSELDIENASPLPFSKETERQDLIFYNVTDKTVPKSADHILDTDNYTVPLAPEDDSNLNIENASLLSFSNETEGHDLIFYNTTDKTVPKSAGLDIDSINYSVPLAFEDHSKLDIENSSQLSFFNETGGHDLIFYNETDKTVPKLIASISYNMNESAPFPFKYVTKSGIENTSVSSSHLTADEFMPRSFDSILENLNYSVPFAFKEYTETDHVNTSLLSFDNITESHELESDNKAEDFVSKSGDPIVDSINYTIPLTVESNNENASIDSHNFTKTRGLELDNMSEDFFSKSESPITDGINQSVPLIVENDNADTSSMSMMLNLTDEHSFITENVTDKIIPKAASSNFSDTINYSMPLLSDEDGRYVDVNESIIDNERNKTFINSLKPELDVASVEDSLMKIHLTSEELDVLPENNTVSNITECGDWAENFEVMMSDNQNPFKLWPAVGYLQMISDSKKCPSTVISPKYVITSLNCLTSSNMELNLDPDKWTYVGGLRNSDMLDEIQTLTISKIIPYPGEFLLLNEHDIALVRLNKSMTISDYSKTACIVQREKEPGKECFTLGWNTNSSDGDIQSEFYSFPLRIISIDECNNTMNYNGILFDGLLCGIRKNENVQSCYMDFGSPLLCLNENKHWELQGILNRPDPCDTTKPIVFSDILSVKQWINEIVTNDDIILDTN